MGAEAILLAAGESSRMGKPKALLDWFGTPLVVAQANSLLNGGAKRVTVVTGVHHDLIRQVVPDKPDVTVINNPNWRSGKTTSIKTGLSALSDECDTIILLAVDQPRPSWVVRRALDSHRNSGCEVTSPRYSGHGGHPLLFDISILDQLKNISEVREGVREVMKQYEDEMNRAYFDNPVIRLDLNTPADYEAALSKYLVLAAKP